MKLKQLEIGSTCQKKKQFLFRPFFFSHVGPIFKLFHFHEFLSVFDRIKLKISGFFQTFRIFEN